MFCKLCTDDFDMAQWDKDYIDLVVFMVLSFIFGRTFFLHPYLPNIKKGGKFDYKGFVSKILYDGDENKNSEGMSHAKLYS